MAFRLYFVFLATLFEAFLAGASTLYIPWHSFSFVLVALTAFLSGIVIALSVFGRQTGKGIDPI